MAPSRARRRRSVRFTWNRTQPRPRGFKYLFAHAREESFCGREMGVAVRVGMASAAEVDELGITGALRRAGLGASNVDFGGAAGRRAVGWNS